jgi:peptidoglycan hydrolase-like protein with peptidoglycan-binding domain
LRDHRRAVILNDNHVHAIVEGEGCDLLIGQRGRGQKGHQAGDQVAHVKTPVNDNGARDGGVFREDTVQYLQIKRV